MTFHIVRARSGADIAATAALFREYAEWLGIDLNYQDFETELNDLPGKYAPPLGELLLARTDDGVALGCVGVRPLNDADICEMKRLYVRPAGRRLGIGKGLTVAIIAAAEGLGYAEMKLDTFPSMSAAIALYRRFGFAEVPAYYRNPFPDALYLGRRLTPLRN